MKLSRASSYALHAIAYMSENLKKGEPVASHIIAEAQGIPDRFLLKVLKPLVDVGILTSIKGPNGGYRLARNVGEISILEILEAVDGPIRGLVPVRLESNSGFNKRLDVFCGDTATTMKKHLSRVKLGDLLNGKR